MGAGLSISAVRGQIVATRSGYPPIILAGNVLWAVVAFRKMYPEPPKTPASSTDGSPSVQSQRPTYRSLYSLIWSYFALAYPGNFTGNWLVLNTTPSAISNPVIFPAHLAAWVALNFCPGDYLYKLLASAPAYDALVTPYPSPSPQASCGKIQCLLAPSRLTEGGCNILISGSGGVHRQHDHCDRVHGHRRCRHRRFVSQARAHRAQRPALISGTPTTATVRISRGPFRSRPALSLVCRCSHAVFQG